jgi:hypothetical protein
LKNTTVTAVLIGAKTAEREWVDYEIIESVKRGNGLLGIYIHNLKNQYGKIDIEGKNQFDKWIYGDLNKSLSMYYYTYDWIIDDGYNNFKDWVELAAKRAGK